MTYKNYDITEYIDFINDCRSKPEMSDSIYHKHHIIPKFMGGNNTSENIIKLSCDDHITAHTTLAMCFPTASHYFSGNISSTLLIRKWVESYEVNIEHLKIVNKHSVYTLEHRKRSSERMSGNFVGKNNPFYGKKHTEETKQKIREKRAIQIITAESKQKRSDTLKSANRKGINNPCYGKKPSLETRQKLSVAGKLRYANIPLPDGIFVVDIPTDENRYFRYCPCCNEKIYYKIKPYSPERKKANCKQCVGKTNKVELKSRPPKRGRNISVYDNVNSVYYQSKHQTFISLDIRESEFKRMIANGNLSIVENNYIK